MSLPNIDKLVGSKGTFLVNNTVEKTVDFAILVVSEDTVISSLKVGGTNVLSTYVANTAGTIKAGTIITGRGVAFSGVTLTSGAVTLVLA